jgi:hypothetical protein
MHHATFEGSFDGAASRGLLVRGHRLGITLLVSLEIEASRARCKPETERG